ncbi:MAG TPA: c-type cytochrome [Terracidiphilus sp.]|nr:c-type cytochrome [Terracidiphilus sp.]
MLKRYVLIAATLLIAATGYAKSGEKTVVIPVNRIDPTDAKLMYTNYCAACHGADGRGHGPLAGALSSSPTDLTTLAKTHGGRYPESHVISVLSFGKEEKDAVMPAWGHVFATLNAVSMQDRVLRISNLTRYLRTMQVK